MKAIIVVDCQNDFSSTGTLPVKGGTELALKIADFLKKLDNKEYLFIFSRDWHPKKHISFESWPVHCVKNTFGSEYIEPLNHVMKDYEILKGTKPKCDSYSAFFKNDKLSKLDKYLTKANVNQIYVCGLVKDVCVLKTANDGITLNYQTHIITDLTLALDEQRYLKDVDPKVIEITSKNII